MTDPCVLLYSTAPRPSTILTHDTAIKNMNTAQYERKTGARKASHNQQRPSAFREKRAFYSTTVKAFLMTTTAYGLILLFFLNLYFTAKTWTNTLLPNEVIAAEHVGVASLPSGTSSETVMARVTNMTYCNSVCNSPVLRHLSKIMPLELVDFNCYNPKPCLQPQDTTDTFQ